MYLSLEPLLIDVQLFITGTVGIIGSDDVLACFIAGNVFTWDDWFRLETMDDSLQPTIDMLLNVSIFMWFGAVCPWHKFVDNNVIPIYRLVPLGILVLLFRRVPMVLAFHKFYPSGIHQIKEIRHALFVGFFGPIGVSAIFYLYISREFLKTIAVDGHERADAERLGEIIEVVVWFLIICSITVHGLSIPLGKLGFYLPRTISTAISTERISATQSMARSQDSDRQEPVPLRQRRPVSEERTFLRGFRRQPTSTDGQSPLSSPTSIHWIPRSFARAAKHIVNDIKRPSGSTVHGKGDGVRPKDHQGADGSDASENTSTAHPEISRPMDARLIGRAINDPPAEVNVEDSDGDVRRVEEGQGPVSNTQSPVGSGATTPTGTGRPYRSIQFADESRRPQAENPVVQSPVGERSEVGSRKSS